MGTRHRRALLLGWVWFLTLSVPLLAAPDPAPRPSPPTRQGEDVRETIQLLMVVSLKRALDLTRQQESEVVPKIQQIFDERERFVRERQAALRRMEVKLMEESVPTREFRSLVLNLDQLEKQHRELESRLHGEIDRFLNPRQQAEFRLFVPRFRKQMQVQVDAARRLEEQMRVIPTPPTPPALEDFGLSEDDEF